MKKMLSLSIFCLLLTALILIQSNSAKAESAIGEGVEYMCCKTASFPEGSYRKSCWNMKWTLEFVRYFSDPRKGCGEKFIARCKSETPTDTGRMSRLNSIPCNKILECQYRLKNVDGRLVCE